MQKTLIECLTGLKKKCPVRTAIRQLAPHVVRDNII